MNGMNVIMGMEKQRAIILYGRLLSKDLLNSIKTEVLRLKSDFGIYPQLSVIEVGNRIDSAVYVDQKRKFANLCGIKMSHKLLPSDSSESQVVNAIQELNTDPCTHGITIQLPLDCKHRLNVRRLLNTVSAEKDVEGLGYKNTALVSREGSPDPLFSGPMEERIHIPCTAAACFAFIRHIEFPLRGSKCVVVGRGRLVGAPTADLLLDPGRATVTQCHIYSENLAEEVARADLVVAGAGFPDLIKGAWIKPGALVLDCGYTIIPDKASRSKLRSVGDVEFDAARDRAGWITPVPGGVGPVTVAMLFRNTLNSALWSIGFPSLQCSFSPVYDTSLPETSTVSQT